MTGWQLETFNESHNNKIKEGMSLYKKEFTKKNLRSFHRVHIT